MTDRELLEAAAKAAAEMIAYDPKDGSMVWLWKVGEDRETKRWNTRLAGKTAGSIDERGYVRIVVKVAGKKMKLRGHTLAWFMVNGCFPSHEIDHINGMKSDNRICNLRDVPRHVNQRNKGLQANNSSGFVGVSRSRGRKKWEAYGRDGNKRIYLGVFNSPELAGEVARAYRMERGYSSRHGL